MGRVFSAVLFLRLLQLAAFTDPESCTIDLDCAECIPDNMPLVTTHRASSGSLTIHAGSRVEFACHGGRFLTYPLKENLAVVCEEGQYRVAEDGALRPLLELGCQENIFEDVLHQVEDCAPPLQGRAYVVRGAGGPRHLAAACFQPDLALPAHAHAASPLRLPPHSDARAPLSLFGNFNHMFDAGLRHDAERLYSDDAALARRLRELVRHDDVALAGQALTAAALLPRGYFDSQDAPVANFASNKVAAWRSVAEGNLKFVQQDVARLLRSAGARGALHVWAGTSGVAGLRGARGRRGVFLKPGRFPAPRYIWTVVADRRRGRALAVVVLNEPLVAVSEIHDAVFCESVCSRVAWLGTVVRGRRFETPAAGLAFCCHVRDLAARVPELPTSALHNITNGQDGLLTEYIPTHE